jgi:choline dehydrogenase
VESRGSVQLRSADPAAAPAIRYNYLATESDRRVMIEGLKLARRIVNTAPLREYVRAEYLPGPGVQGDSEWLDYCRGMGETVFHPTSTCRIGAVVDEELKVKGLSGLRVIDASVMPAVPSGNINAAVIAIAEKGADLVKQENG